MLSVAQNSVNVLQQWGGIEVPETLEAALKGDWLRVAQRGAEGITGGVEKGEMEEWSRRVMTLDAANRTFRDFEENLVLKYAVAVDSVLQKAVSRILLVPQFVATHLGDIYSIILPLLGSFVAGYTGAFADAVEGTFALYLRNLNPDDEIWDQAVERTTRALDNQAEAMELLLLSATAVLVYYSVEELLALSYSLEAMRENCIPARKQLDDACDAAKSNALPQRVRKVFRRRKRAR